MQERSEGSDSAGRTRRVVLPDQRVNEILRRQAADRKRRGVTVSPSNHGIRVMDRSIGRLREPDPVRHRLDETGFVQICMANMAESSEEVEADETAVATEGFAYVPEVSGGDADDGAVAVVTDFAVTTNVYDLADPYGDADCDEEDEVDDLTSEDCVNDVDDEFVDEDSILHFE